MLSVKRKNLFAWISFRCRSALASQFLDSRSSAHNETPDQMQSQNCEVSKIAIDMVNWICYPNGDEPDMWTAWHRLQDGAVRAKHATAMRFLTAGIWKMPHYRPLTGKHVKGLGEIRVRGDVQWRLIGFRDTGKDTFTIVMICNHKGGVYKPVDAFEISADRRKEMLNGLRGVALNVHPN